MSDTTNARDDQQRVLQLIGLEDRLLFSATPLSPEMVEADPQEEADVQPVSAAEGNQAQQQQNPDGQDANLQSESDLAAGVSDDFILQWDPNSLNDSNGQSILRRELVSRGHECPGL